MSSSLAMICGSPSILAPDGQGLNREFSPAALTLVVPQGELRARRGADLLRQPAALRSGISPG
jgi:hypothetical protein